MERNIGKGLHTEKVSTRRGFEERRYKGEMYGQKTTENRNGKEDEERNTRKGIIHGRGLHGET